MKSNSKKSLKIFAIVMACLFALLMAYSIYACIPVNTNRRSDDFVYAYYNDIYLKNDLLRLTGINIGSWLIPEGWMSIFRIPGQNDNVEGEKLTHLKLLECLKNNPSVGSYEKADELLDIYYANWFTKEDLVFIKECGFNSIRLAFAWFTLYNLDFTPKADGFKWLDQCIEWCEELDLYVVLDCHGVPGSQNKEHHSGDDTQSTFFTNTEYQDFAVEMWKSVASRYKDKTIIAGYDLLNEPCGIDHQSSFEEYVVLDKLYDAVRSVDQNHMIIMEAAWEFVNLCNPLLYGWENVMYSYHWYRPGGFTMDFYLAYQNFFHTLCSYKNVPIYMGEFGLGDDYNDMKTLLDLFKNNGWSWGMWTYKTNDSWNWGLLCQWKKDIGSLDSMTYDEIATMFADVRTNFNNKTDAYRNLMRYKTEEGF